MVTCPFMDCRKAFDVDGQPKRYVKTGRKVQCPKCKRWVLVECHVPIQPKEPGTGKEHMSKKRRLRMRHDR